MTITASKPCLGPLPSSSLSSLLSPLCTLHERLGHGVASDQGSTWELEGRKEGGLEGLALMMQRDEQGRKKLPVLVHTFCQGWVLLYTEIKMAYPCISAQVTGQIHITTLYSKSEARTTWDVVCSNARCWGDVGVGVSFRVGLRHLPQGV